MNLHAGGNLIPLQKSLHLAQAEQTVHKTHGRNESSLFVSDKSPSLCRRLGGEAVSESFPETLGEVERRRARFTDVCKSNPNEKSRLQIPK